MAQEFNAAVPKHDLSIVWAKVHHEATFIRRIIGWQSAAHYKWETELAASCGFCRGSWRRMRIGRPPRRWETPMVTPWG